MTEAIRNAILNALKLSEASIKRMQNAKPQYKEIYIKELTDLNDARKFINEYKINK